MRFLFAPFLWAVTAGAQVIETRVPPAPPPPPPVEHRDTEPDRQVMAGAKDDGRTTLATTLYSIGQPTDEEQYYLELINRARANPAAEGARLAATTDPSVTSAYAQFNVDLTIMQSEFDALAPKPPLAMNEELVNAARAHSQNMFDMKFQGHFTNNNPAAGGPGDRALAAGYSFTSLGENVFSFAESVFHGHAGFEVDWGADGGGSTGGMQSNRGHRKNIHSVEAEFREVGIGIVNGTNGPVGPQLVTQDFGTAQGSTPFVTGVVYYDLNGNNFYDVGEGIGGITVEVAGSSFHAVTANSGGYAVPVPASNTSRAVTFSGLGISGNGTATITGLGNAKVDHAPIYAAPVVTGPAVASTAAATAYEFTPVNGAAAYEWRRATAAAAANDTAANLSRVTVTKTGVYNSIVSGAYHLAHVTPPAEQAITYNGRFLVGNSASVTLQSKLVSGSGEAARVQISSNEGLSWEDIDIQSGEIDQGAFGARLIPLTAYAGKEVRLRFLFSFAAGTYFEADDGVGWFIDSVSFTNVSEISNAVITSVPAGTSFNFTPPAAGDYVLAVRPLVTGGRPLPFGPLKAVSGFDGPPPPAEISVQQPAGTQLTDNLSSIGFGSVELTESAIKTFTITNAGGEDLTGLSVSIGGADAGDFSAGALGATTLAGGQSTTFAVTFAPSAIGARAASLQIASSDVDENPFDVGLTGTGFAEPDIALQHPAAANLISGVSTVNYGVVTLEVSASKTFTIKNNGSGELTGFVVSVVGAHAADYTAGDPAAAALAPGETTTFEVSLRPTATGARNATLRVASNDPDLSPFEVNLTGTGDAKPVVSAPAPAAVMRQVGGAQVDFAVAAAPNPLTFQWRKNGAAIAGATSDTLSIVTPALVNAGAYTVLVKRGTLSVISAVAQLGVADNAPKPVPAALGGSVTLTVAAAGNGLQYKWRRMVGGLEEDLPAEARFKGLGTKTLTISGLKPEDSTEYFCEVSNAGGMVKGGTSHLRVFGSAPIIDVFDPDDGVVGGPYSYQLEMNDGVDVTPTAYAATGLPPGLKLGTKTGIISGRPTKAGEFTIKITASNSKGKSSVSTAMVKIDPFPMGLAGAYTGWIERSGINGNLGGRIDLTVSGTGAYTGSLTMGVTKYPLKGNLDIDVLNVQLPRTELQIKRSGKPVPDPLEMVLEISANAFTANSEITADGDSSAITGWRQVWHATTNVATTYLGYYTSILRLGAAVPEAPQGTGYASFTVGKDGKLTVAGKTADGEGITCATFISADGEIAFFMPLYIATAKGSLLGQMQIAAGVDNASNTFAGALDWRRPQNLKVRVYKDGFGIGAPVPVNVVGGRFTGGAAILILGLTSGDDARLVFSDGGLGDSRRDPNITVTVGDKNKLTIPPNETSTKLTVNATTGLFSGSFVLDDPDPRKPPPAKEVILKRTVPFQGILVKDGGTPVGEGYFLLPQLPEGAITPTTSAILSGKVVLEED